MLSSSRMEKSKIRPIKSWLVKVFDECLDVLYQNLFFGAINYTVWEKKLVQSVTKFVPPKFLY